MYRDFVEHYNRKTRRALRLVATTLMVVILGMTGCSNNKSKDTISTKDEIEESIEVTTEPTVAPKDQTVADEPTKQVEDVVADVESVEAADWKEAADALMQKRIFEKDVTLVSEVKDSSSKEDMNIGTYVKTLSQSYIGVVSTTEGEEELLQLFWQCEGGENLFNIDWFDGSEWVINVYAKQGKITRYEILPCSYNAVKTGIGAAKLMQNGPDAVQLAYNTFLDDSAKGMTSKQDYEQNWNDVISSCGTYASNNSVYYGYKPNYSYPFVSIIWNYDNGFVQGVYQFAGGNTKAIGYTLTSSQTQPVIEVATVAQQEQIQAADGDQLSLKEIYKDSFQIGAAIPAQFFKSWKKNGENVVEKDFNSVTLENEMKPDYVLDQQECKKGVKDDPTFVSIKDDCFKEAADLLVEKGISMRYHTLVWHQQTPNWFFYEDYDVDKNLVDAETMKKRLKNFIHEVIYYLDTYYPGLIYTIDVVNEAFNGSGTYHTTNNKNLWYDTLGYEYVYYAFQYAREEIDASKNMKDVTLTYNDYAMPDKVDYVLEGLEAIFKEHDADVHDYIDVIGFQAHYDTSTSMERVAKTVEKVCKKGYEVQITELDIGIPDIKIGQTPSEEQFKLQGEKYRSLMERLLKLKEEGCNITAVTVWGLKDDMSWRQGSDGKDAYALLRGKEFVYKPAYFGMALDPSVLSYCDMGIAY